MTGRFSNFDSISYTEDRYKVRVTGTKCPALAKYLFQALLRDLSGAIQQYNIRVLAVTMFKTSFTFYPEFLEDLAEELNTK